nr:MAG TPA: hypothetical protein [Caudoviricetes sp.]
MIHLMHVGSTIIQNIISKVRRSAVHIGQRGICRMAAWTRSTEQST